MDETVNEILSTIQDDIKQKMLPIVAALAVKSGVIRLSEPETIELLNQARTNANYLTKGKYLPHCLECGDSDLIKMGLCKKCYQDLKGEL